MLSQTESWAEDSDSSSAEEGARQDSFLGGGIFTYRPPRLCRIVNSAKVKPYEAFHAAQSKLASSWCGGGGRAGGALGGDWVDVSQCRATATATATATAAAGRQQQPNMVSQRDSNSNMWVLVVCVQYRARAGRREGVDGWSISCRISRCRPITTDDRCKCTR